MALENSDLLVVQRPGTSDLYKLAIGDLPLGDGGGANVIISEDPPPPFLTAEGQLWWCDSDELEGGGRLYIYTGSEWVDISQPGGGSGEGGGASVSVSEDAPVGATEGDLWYSNSTDLEFGGRLYIYIDGVWVDASLPGGGGGGGEGGSSSITVSETPPSAEQGSLWWANSTVDDGGGRLYIYLDGQWVDTSLPGGGGAGGDFLSKTEDDTAAGAITFESQTTHLNGLAGIGGSRFRGGCVFENTQGAGQKEASLSWTRANDQVKGSIGTGVDGGGTNALYIQSDTEHPIIIGTHDTPRLTISEIGASSFAGKLNVAGTVIFTNQADGTADVKGCTYQTNGVVKIRRNTSSGSDNPCIELKRTNSGSSQGWMTLKNSNHDGSVLSKMTIGGDLARIVDARLSPTGTPLPDGAADIVKQLQPKVITQQGHTFQGFLPTDLTPVFSDAVFGTAGETVAVGTYTDTDGVVETEVEEPEAIPFGATWEQTDTQDVMQSVCRERLIPLLTKALQETIAKNEQLEARLAAIESNEIADDAIDTSLLSLVASLTERVAALEGGNN